MKVLILFDRESGVFAETIGRMLATSGHEDQRISLSREAIRPCLGCFGCWTKTPGMCVITGDKANDIARMEMQSDAVLLLSRITYGGFGADVKAFLDRSIQNILPFFEAYKGEMHHAMRYERFPIWIAVGHGDASEEERRTFIELAERNARNMRPPRHLAVTMRLGDEATRVGEEVLRVLEVGA